MNTYTYKNKNIEKELQFDNGTIVGVTYRNKLTGRVFNTDCDGFEICYCQNGRKKKQYLNWSNSLLKEINDDGYVLSDRDNKISIKILYSAESNGTLLKRLQVQSDDNIFLNYVTIEKFSVQNASYMWQAPYAGKTYLSQSIARLGQPLYIGDLFFGGESPVCENTIANQCAYCRYHTGRYIDEVCDGRIYNLPPAVVGGGSADNFAAMRKAFFEYVDSFARPAKLRIQYNSWYDNMLDISPKRISDSFKQIYEALRNTGMRDLDCYVVDDGWTEYKKPVFWQFNDKFPNEFNEEAKLTESFGSKFGVWFGPRGGYTLQTIKYAHLLEKIGYHVNRRSRDICTADARYIKDLCDRMAEFCEKYNVSYFKIDGFAKKPCKGKGHNHPIAKGEGFAFYTFFWEEWIKGFERIRNARPDVCLNITSYVHCSPWFLKWVDYIWMNNAADMGYVGSGDDLSMCLNYRDGRYRNFYEERQLQFPQVHMYNHEPCYAFKNYNTAYRWKKNTPVVYTGEEFRQYLRCCMMRGSGLLEMYFSPGMMDCNKWTITAEVLKWAEENFDVLSTSQFFGGKPEKGEIYGYYAVRDDKRIIMMRNSGAKTKKYSFDLLGVGQISGILQPYEIKFIENY